MKAPSRGGLPTLQSSSSSSYPKPDSQNSTRRSSKQRVRQPQVERYSLQSALAETASFICLLALLTICLAIPSYLQTAHLAKSLGFVGRAAWELPVLIVLSCIVTISVAAWLWTTLFRSKLCTPKAKQRILGLIFLLPAIFGMMLAGSLSQSELAREGVGSTIAAASVIATCLLFATVIGRTASTFIAIALCILLNKLGVCSEWAIWAAGIASVAGQYSARKIRNRSAVIRAATITMFAAGITGFVWGSVVSQDLGEACALGMQALLTGCLGAALWFTLLTVMERPYELTTPLGLLELLDPTRPILERFAREAPGTYAHSIMVGHLASTAADAIRADSLLCRVAAQYHDIGKLTRAQFFKENQPGTENVHDKLNPSLSAIVVNSHVKDGERMAKELGLPRAITDIITQHHGTTLMRYFYYQASAGAQPHSHDPLQYQFRYAGPKPQTKEAAIMMLADSIEAASRTLLKPTRESVDGLIASIIDDRVSDSQLDECPITIKELAAVRRAFADVLCAMMHQRIEYPQARSGLQQDILTDTVAARFLESRSDDVDTIPFDFYEDFDPTILFESHENSIDHSNERPSSSKSFTNNPARRHAIITRSRGETHGRRFGSGVKRPSHD